MRKKERVAAASEIAGNRAAELGDGACDKFATNLKLFDSEVDRNHNAGKFVWDMSHSEHSMQL